MALINCPECGKRISDKANNCLNCGFKLNNDSFSSIIDRFGFKKILFGTILMFVSFYLIDSFSNKNENSELSTFQKAIGYKWRDVNSNEFITLGKIIVENEINFCGEYKVKQLDKSEYLIGCTSDGIIWQYRTLDLAKGKIYYLPIDISKKIKAPR